MGYLDQVAETFMILDIEILGRKILVSLSTKFI
jgi:hypothetical protein